MTPLTPAKLTMVPKMGSDTFVIARMMLFPVVAAEVLALLEYILVCRIIGAIVSTVTVPRSTEVLSGTIAPYSLVKPEMETG